MPDTFNVVRLKQAKVQRCLQVGVVEPNGKVGLLGLLGLKELLKNATGIICANDLDGVSGLVGEFVKHLIRKCGDVVGQTRRTPSDARPGSKLHNHRPHRR